MLLNTVCQTLPVTSTLPCQGLCPSHPARSTESPGLLAFNIHLLCLKSNPTLPPLSALFSNYQICTHYSNTQQKHGLICEAKPTTLSTPSGCYQLHA